MEQLRQRILADGRALSDRVLLVDSFLNHQVDAQLMRAVGEEFARRFAGSGVTRVVILRFSPTARYILSGLTDRRFGICLTTSNLRENVKSFPMGATVSVALPSFRNFSAKL